MLSDELKLEHLQTTVDQAVLDPAKWVAVCDRLSEFIGGVGAAFGPDEAEYQMPNLIVASPSLEGLVETVFRDGWISRNYRRRAFPLIRERGIATDYDIADERTLRTEPFYADLMASQKLGVFVGLKVVTTSHTFIACVERAASAPPPDSQLFERAALAQPILAGGARASVALGALRLETWKDVAASDGARAIFVLDPLGRVIDRNAASEALVGTALELSQAQIRLRDRREDQQLARLIGAACAPGAHVLLPRPVFTAPSDGQRGLMFEAVRVPETLRFFHSLAAALLIVRPVEDRHGDLANLLRQQGLTPAETKVALALFEGQSLSGYARAAELAIGTVRQQIKSVYRKTGTGRQNELSALIRRLLESVAG